MGKLNIEEGILNKAGRLTEREEEEVRRHPDVGYRILCASGSLSELADCVLAHHERWDGKGYPRGISGEEIMLEARIIALADTYDAMSSERPYRKAMNEEVILHEIKRNAGYQFDPEIAQAFVEEFWENLGNNKKAETIAMKKIFLTELPKYYGLFYQYQKKKYGRLLDLIYNDLDLFLFRDIVDVMRYGRYSFGQEVSKISVWMPA